MASKNFPVMNSIEFHVNKLAHENHTSEFKNDDLLPFPYEDEDLPTQAAVNVTTTSTTINSTNNASTSNNTINDANRMLITSSTTTTATNNRTDNENTNNKQYMILTNSWHQQVHQQLQQITTQIV